MRIYVAGVSGDTQYVNSLRTFYEIELRPGDLKQERASGRGDVARMLAGDDFYERKEFDAIAMFDLDMLHPPDILEKLRSHDLDMVTGHYYARNARHIHSIIWEIGDGKWPFIPMINVPRSGLHQVAVTGMGCVLIKREVFEAVAKHMPPGDHPFSIGAAPEVTGDHRILGTDFRFFSLAYILGYKLWLDAEVESRHGTIFWLGREIADKLYDPAKNFNWLLDIAEQYRKASGMNEKYLETRIKALEERLKDLSTQFEQAKKNAEFLERQAQVIRVSLNEDKFLLEEMKRGADFPVIPEGEKQEALDNRTGLKNTSEKEARIARESWLKDEAKGFADDIQTVREAGEVQGTA